MSWWQRLGVYRSLPIFFLAGAAVEWFMINVRVGKETFCEHVYSSPHSLQLATLVLPSALAQ